MARLVADATDMNWELLDASGGGTRARVFPVPIADSEPDSAPGISCARSMPMDVTSFGLSRISWLAGLTGRGGESVTSTTSSLGPGSAGVFDLARHSARKGLAKPQ
jgi:hypothetical protein